VLSDLVGSRRASAKLVGMQLIVENVANQLFTILREAIADPLVRTVLDYVARDEKKHTGLAVLYLPTILNQVSFLEAEWLQLEQLYWTFCIAQSIWNQRTYADALGIDIRAGLERGIRAQDHLVEQMGIRRGIFKSRRLENLVLGIYARRDARRRATTS